MGAADLVPGVSGGTMALVFGVYERLLSAITSVNRRAFDLLLRGKMGQLGDHIQIRFLVPLGLGILSAIVLLAEPLGRLLDDPLGRIFLFAFFFGLVVASVIAISGRIRWYATTVGTVLLGTIIGYLVVTTTPSEGSTSNIALFASGAIAICAMMLPGISGSFILLILGQYDHVLDAVRSRDIVVILIFGAGAVIGLLAFARVLRRLLARFRNQTLGALVGFMAGSLWEVWPWRSCTSFAVTDEGSARCISEAIQIPALSMNLVLAIGLAMLGGLIVTAVDHAESGANPLARVAGSPRHRRAAKKDA